MKNSLKSLLYFTNAQKVLYFLLQNPSGKFYDREIAKLTSISPSGTNFSLRDLAAIGLVHRARKGRMYFYSINPEDTLIRELKILQNIVELMPLISEIKNHCLRIVLYGSAAKGTNQEESDIDLFVLSRLKEKVVERAHKYLSKLRINPVIHTPQEWIKIEKENEVFVNLIEQGIVIWGIHESRI